ncbi:MAG: urea ABC transporter substrate-binding protein [Bernardetiaceae bacterium]
MIRFIRIILLLLLAVSCQENISPIKVGILHSLTGTMAISEQSVADATLLAIEEINAAGGLLGRRIEPVLVDGASDWTTFAQQAERLIQIEKTDVVFGCWTSASRKTVKPVFEKYDHLLFYPVQYEGLEASPNIVYTGAAPNQQLRPAVKWAFDNIGKRFFLIGSDYVFPQTASRIMRDLIEELGGEVVGDAFILLGSTDVDQAVADIIQTKPDVIMNTINGDSNIAFFKALAEAGLDAQTLPSFSFSIAEDELRHLDAKQFAGAYTVWNYFQSVDSPQNRDFVERYKSRYGEDRVTDDPIEAGYFGVYLWAQAVRAAGSTAPADVRAHLSNQSFEAPQGLVYIDGQTQHTWKTVRVGKFREDGQVDIVWDSGRPVRPIPYPENRPRQVWERFLDDLYRGWGFSWANPGK